LDQTPVTGGEVGGGRLVTDVSRCGVEDRFGCEVYRGLCGVARLAAASPATPAICSAGLV